MSLSLFFILPLFLPLRSYQPVPSLRTASECSPFCPPQTAVCRAPSAVGDLSGGRGAMSVECRVDSALLDPSTPTPLACCGLGACPCRPLGRVDGNSIGYMQRPAPPQLHNRGPLWLAFPLRSTTPHPPSVTWKLPFPTLVNFPIPPWSVGRLANSNAKAAANPSNPCPCGPSRLRPKRPR